MYKKDTVMVTGGAGFIGGAFVDHILDNKMFDRVITLDKMTYASSSKRVEMHEKSQAFKFIRGDIADTDLVREIIAAYSPSVIVNFAAESHVDNSLRDEAPFYRTNYEGVKNLLECSNRTSVKLFVQISTDEVYGQRKGRAYFKENAPYNPRNPYAKTKVLAEEAVIKNEIENGLKYLITRGCNSFGPWQHCEKLIPKAIVNALANESIPVYGSGLQMREWISAKDHAGAVAHLINRGIENEGIENEIFNIGSGYEIENIELVNKILDRVGKPKSLVCHVADRLNHDDKYGVNIEKISQTGWRPVDSFEDTLHETIEFYKAGPGHRTIKI